MPRAGATIFDDLIGKLDVLHVACAPAPAVSRRAYLSALN
jgi:hypothetical protein